MLRAKDIMTKEHLIAVNENTPVYEAVRLVVEHGVSGIPVVDKNMKLVGLVSEKDLLRLFSERKKAEKQTVSDFMTQPAIHFDEEEDLSDVCDFLMRNIFRRVPITSKEKLVGIISIRDALQYVLELKGKEAVEQAKEPAEQNVSA
jgi:CBS domain-containing protein